MDTELCSANASTGDLSFPSSLAKMCREGHRLGSLFFTSLSAGCGQLIRTPEVQESMASPAFICDTDWEKQSPNLWLMFLYRV